MKVLVIGGNGYIGQRFIRYIADTKGVTTLVGSRSPNRHAVYIDWLRGDADFNAIKKAGPIDSILHLAFPDRHTVKQYNSDQLLKTVRKGIKFLIQLAEKIDAKSICHLSTAKVYGNNIVGYINETAPVNPEDLYSAMHREAELGFEKNSRNRNIQFLSIRLSNAFGYPENPDTQRWDLIVNEMCKNAFESGEIVLGGGAKQRKDFIPLSVVVKRLFLFLTEPGKNGIAQNRNWSALNLASGHAMRIEKMAERVQTIAEEILNKNVSINYLLSVESLEIKDDFQGFISNNSSPLPWNVFNAETQKEIDKTIRKYINFRNSR